uniref:Chromosome 18 open reading frame 54 n=1 Tax=Sphenodon punctatus TaxID=8508 RepID=A0A8D0HKZ3_SPHPU
MKSLKKSTAYPSHQAPSFDIERGLNFKNASNVTGNQNPVTPSSYKDFSKKEVKVDKTYKYDSGTYDVASEDCLFENGSEFVSVKNYPRWLTSQKSDLNVSGISSLPDFKYPIWLKSHNLLLDSANQSFIQAFTTENESALSKTCKKLEGSQTVNKQSNSNSPKRGSYLDLAGEVGRNYRYDSPSAYFQPENLIAMGQSTQTFRDDQTELILLKAKRALESSAEEITSALKKDGSPCTADVLDAERSWENVPVVFKSPVPVQCDEDENTLQNPKASIFNGFLEDCLNNGCQESTFSGGNHHGPVEALKLMLFNLQAVQQSLTPNRTAEQNEFKKNFLFKLSEEAVSELMLCDSEVIPVTKSLQRALHHLSRLKGLVDNTASKEDPKEGCQEEEKEKVA